MASYRPFRPPPPSRFAPAPPPSQNPLRHAPPLPPSHGGSQYLLNCGPYSANENFNCDHSYSQTNASSNNQLSGNGSSSSQQQQFNPPSRNQNLPLPQQQPFQPKPQPPQPESSSYPPSAPPPQAATAPPMYYPSSQYSQLNQPQLLQPIQLPPCPPLPSFPPPRPPPSQPSSSHLLASGIPPGDINRENRYSDMVASVREEYKPLLLPTGQELNGERMLGRVEIEEERSLRRKRDCEKQKQEEKLEQHLREPQNEVSLKTQMLAYGPRARVS